MEAVNQLINYLIESEQKHFEEDPSAKHIYISALKAREQVKKVIPVSNVIDLLQSEYDEAAQSCEDNNDDEFGDIYDNGFNDGYRDGIGGVLYLIREGKEPKLEPKTDETQLTPKQQKELLNYCNHFAERLQDVLDAGTHPWGSGNAMSDVLAEYDDWYKVIFDNQKVGE